MVKALEVLVDQVALEVGVTTKDGTRISHGNKEVDGVSHPSNSGVKVGGIKVKVDGNKEHLEPTQHSSNNNGDSIPG